MKQRYSYCEFCKADVLYDVIEQQSDINICGKTINYMEKIARCRYCHHEIFVMHLMDENIAYTNRLLQEKQGKIYVVASYLLQHDPKISALVLQKALYYCQGLFYAFHHTFLFENDAQAWVHGPVYKEIYHAFKQQEKQFFQTEPSLNPEEKEVVDAILRYICCYRGETLQQMTHLEQPWLQTRKELPRNTKTDRIIKKDKIAKFFETIKQRYAMKQPCDIRLYAQDFMNKIHGS
ncbi:MAG: DUF4065 domain-containing protein [Erysipelotrichaceae bacterium]|nr:DUF4065 domain-containing protein [Erysipelotrichaceae bacterium]